jgi:4-amino-4-deoxy-L-arabinose transferase-like glycosyltransferase
MEPRPSVRRAWLLLILLTVVLRLPAIVHPMSLDDEGGYAVVAHELLEGGTLYQSALDRRPPLLFWIYAGVFGVVGEYNWLPFHLFGVAWILLTMAGLYAIASRLFSREVGIAAALLYSICTARPDWVNLALNGEVMMNLPIVWGLFLTFRISGSRIRWELAASGVLLACAFLIKQPAAVVAVPVGLYLLLPSYRARHDLSPRHAAAQAGLLTAGYALTLGAAAFILHRRGILADAWYWTFGDHDVPHGPTDPVFWQRGGKETLATAAAWHPLLACSVVSIRDRFHRARYWRGREPELVALVLLLGFSSVGVCASGRFYSHYFFQLLPALVLLGAPALAAIWTGAVTYRFPLLRRGVLGFLLAGTAAAFLIVNGVGLWPWRTPSPLSQYVRDHSGRQDKVFFWGQRDWFYAEAQRRPASRFILCFPLTGYLFGSPLADDPDHDTTDRILPGAWETLEREFAEHPPLFFVDTDPGTVAKKYPPSQYPYLRRLLAEGYEEVFATAEGVVYRLIDFQRALEEAIDSGDP